LDLIACVLIKIQGRGSKFSMELSELRGQFMLDIMTFDKY